MQRTMVIRQENGGMTEADIGSSACLIGRTDIIPFGAYGLSTSTISAQGYLNI